MSREIQLLKADIVQLSAESAEDRREVVELAEQVGHAHRRATEAEALARRVQWRAVGAVGALLLLQVATWAVLHPQAGKLVVAMLGVR